MTTLIVALAFTSWLFNPLPPVAPTPGVLGIVPMEIACISDPFAHDGDPTWPTIRGCSVLVCHEDSTIGVMGWYIDGTPGTLVSQQEAAIVIPPNRKLLERWALEYPLFVIGADYCGVEP